MAEFTMYLTAGITDMICFATKKMRGRFLDICMDHGTPSSGEGLEMVGLR